MSNSHPEFPRKEKIRKATKCGWLFHMKGIEDVCHFDASLAALGPGNCDYILRRLEYRPLCAPLEPATIRAASGKEVEFHPIFLPVTSARMKEALDGNGVDSVRSLIRNGLTTAMELGCQVVSLGQYTSIVGLNGHRSGAAHIGITTGNSLTVVMAVEALKRAASDRGLVMERSTAAVIGASGSIGAACATLLADRIGRLILVGSKKPNAMERLRQLSRNIASRNCNSGFIEITTDIVEIRKAQIIVSAVNSSTPVLGAGELHPGAVICDISVPSSVSGGVSAVRPDVFVFQGGAVRLPGEEPVPIPGFPLAKGRVYACMAEGMLLALEGIRDHSFLGAPSADNIERIGASAARHGFTLAEFRQ